MQCMVARVCRYSYGTSRHERLKTLQATASSLGSAAGTGCRAIRCSSESASTSSLICASLDGKGLPTPACCLAFSSEYMFGKQQLLPALLVDGTRITQCNMQCGGITAWTMQMSSHTCCTPTSRASVLAEWGYTPSSRTTVCIASHRVPESCFRGDVPCLSFSQHGKAVIEFRRTKLYLSNAYTSAYNSASTRGHH